MIIDTVWSIYFPIKIYTFQKTILAINRKLHFFAIIIDHQYLSMLDSINDAHLFTWKIFYFDQPMIVNHFCAHLENSNLKS